MSEENKNLNTPDNNENSQEYSLNDDRRVKTLSPGRLVAKRFFRNRVAVTGLIILAFMFVFSFIGGWITPYAEDQLFYREDEQNKQYAGVTENTELRYVVAEGESFPALAQAQFYLAQKSGEEEFSALGKNYSYKEEGEDFYSLYSKDGKIPVLIAFASKTIVSSSTGNEKVPFDLQYELLHCLNAKEKSFELDGVKYEVDDDGVLTKGGEEIAYASQYVVQAIMGDVYLTRSFKEELIDAISIGDTEFVFTDEDGTTAEYTITYNAATKAYSVLQTVSTRVFDTYSPPSGAHWLGTDRNGMDMLTRLMYGGRVSLYIGFIVVIIESVIGVILGGISGYFGGWVDNLIMRIVDIFYCIPSMPIIIILGAAMDAMRMDPQLRMVWLMLILGFLGWAGIARLVRGQILSLREQEFMTATEATGIRVSRRIFKHLIPNVIPQLIVTMTMSLGSTILIEATLSFLGLGVKFPFASWGNIINDVNDTHVLTNYWFIWIPAGICLVATVLAFNLVGDGLRDAFDPKMKR
ncbi:MAG: ABC transporter permease [Lachnospiraceae bacterium]|nr:ABC transporter permease [Lachnospiraceae bacterium]